jgi:hypothetical protein
VLFPVITYPPVPFSLIANMILSIDNVPAINEIFPLPSILTIDLISVKLPESES